MFSDIPFLSRRHFCPKFQHVGYLQTLQSNTKCKLIFSSILVSKPTMSKQIESCRHYVNLTVIYVL